MAALLQVERSHGQPFSLAHFKIGRSDFLTPRSPILLPTSTPLGFPSLPHLCRYLDETYLRFQWHRVRLKGGPKRLLTLFLRNVPLHRKPHSPLPTLILQDTHTSPQPSTPASSNKILSPSATSTPPIVLPPQQPHKPRRGRDTFGGEQIKIRKRKIETYRALTSNNHFTISNVDFEMEKLRHFKTSFLDGCVRRLGS